MEVLQHWERLTWNPPGGLGWLFLLLAAAAVGFAVLAYRRTDAPLPPATRGLLTALRAGMLLLLLAVLCRPVLSLALPGGAERGVLVLYDRSLSMTLPGAVAGESRDQELQRARVALTAALDGRYPLREVGFSARPGDPLDRAEPLAPADGEGTDLGAALEMGITEGGREGRPGAAVLVTDGVATAGADAVPLARRLGLPVATVALGSGTPVNDLALVRVRANHDAFLGEPTPVEAVLRLQAASGGEVEVVLFDVTGERTEVARERVTLSGQGSERRVPLVFEPKEAGLRFLEVVTNPHPDEATAANNRRLVALDVREQKTGVLLLSGALTWDHTFLRRAIAADSSLTLRAAFWKQGGFFDAARRETLDRISAESLREWALVVLDRVDPAQLGASGAAALAGYVRGGGGVILVTGSAPDGLTRWRGTPIEPLLPLALERSGAVREMDVRLGPLALRSPLFDPTVPEAPPREAWNGLPPLELPPGAGALKAGAEALLVTAAGGQPVLAYAGAESGRVLLLAAAGIWRWDFLNPALRPSGAMMPAWWRRTVEWMARPLVETRLDVHPADPVVRRGEPVRFVARALDAEYRPVPDVAVDVTVESDRVDSAGADARTLSLTGEEGFLSGALGDLPPGRYRFRAEATAGATSLGQVSGRFAVDSLGTEFERLEADHEMLARLAAATGGSFWRADSLDGLAESLALVGDREAERRQIDLWDHPFTFALFVFLGSTEWFLRRRRGLI